MADVARRNEIIGVRKAEIKKLEDEYNGLRASIKESTKPNWVFANLDEKNKNNIKKTFQNVFVLPIVILALKMRVNTMIQETPELEFIRKKLELIIKENKEIIEQYRSPTKTIVSKEILEKYNIVDEKKKINDLVSELKIQLGEQAPIYKFQTIHYVFDKATYKPTDVELHDIAEGGFYEKYIKYKNKYLELKTQLNQHK
jgi:hypothetical protein